MEEGVIHKVIKGIPPKQEYCRLCAKYKNESLTSLSLGEVVKGVECSIKVCSSCHIIHHNLALIWNEAIHEFNRKEKEKALLILKEKGGVLPDAFTQNSPNR